MHLPFIAGLQQSDSVQELLSHIPERDEPRTVHGFVGGIRGLLAALYHQRHDRQTVLVCPDPKSAIDAINDARLLLGEQKAVFIGDRYTRSQKAVRTMDNSFAENADILRSLTEDPNRLIITDYDSLMMEFPASDTIKENSIRIERMTSMKQSELVKKIAFGGFERNEFVTVNGEYAVRGGIIDVYPVGLDNPVRIEFFGDEIDSIREFDPMSQRSIRHLDSVSFVTSLFVDEQQDAESLTTESMFQFFSEDAVLFVEEPTQLLRTADRLEKERMIEKGLEQFARFYPTVVSEPGTPPIDIAADTQPSFNGSMTVLQEEIDKMVLDGMNVVLVADSEQQVRRLTELMEERFEEDENLTHTKLPVHLCPLSAGFILHDSRIAVLTEHQIFNRQRVQKKLKKGKKGLSLRDMRQLHVGDFVVHVDKGIGKFAGFHTIKVNDGLQETAKIIYSGDDVLYVNLNYLNRLQKYTSEEGHTPKLSKLGSGEWERMRARTKSKLKDIARDLIRLYAKRKMSKGFAFSEDTAWQKELEASFMYEDTPDQYTATQDVKKDMQEAMPMDRLVCGDVGYGKTEVAVRAAFKAIMDGKQVAILVPTTILAQQHYNTFRDRLSRYSVEVEVISRFRTKAEQTEIVSKVKSGKVDILIGTHRLLSKDIAFANLGLLVVDEEHRFGVAAKEKLRMLRENVDTLTMTATPIPRTLNFSLLGARDLSTIETPPKNRLPIITSIVPWSKDVIVEGIRHELERGGQVYFVNDKVKDIDYLADTLRSMLPDVRIAVAHGQMRSTELERIMMRFMEKKIDVLVATKIIESGLDIPNANTIFINRSERFGLAELYQLRGRVGRSNTQAFAYLLIPTEGKLSRDALKRLQAIEEFSELGTGFHLSMRDLEIRGAGNLLGAEQSGFIFEIGFELYMATVDEAVQELKEEEFNDLFADQPKEKIIQPRSDVIVELGLDAYFPQDYIGNSTERFELYKKLYNAQSEEEIKQVEEEVFDRFGLFTQEAENLFYIVRLRLQAAKVRLSRVTWSKGKLLLGFPPQEDEDFYEHFFQPLITWIMDNDDRMKLTQDAQSVQVVINDVPDLKAVEALLEELVREVGSAVTTGEAVDEHAG